MYYSNMVGGKFLSRPNRFIAMVEIDGKETVCHVKNTGRCRELLTPGAVVYCQHFPDSDRKTAYDLITVEKGKRLVNMDSQAPNRVFREWVEANGFCGKPAALWPEYRYGQSRLDFRIDTEDGTWMVEVKGVTLEEDGHVRFPDAPTQRGARHLQELIKATEEGYRAAVVFIVQMEDVEDFRPNDATDPEFAAALRQAAAAGVKVLALDCHVEIGSLTVGKEVQVIL